MPPDSSPWIILLIVAGLFFVLIFPRLVRRRLREEPRRPLLPDAGGDARAELERLLTDIQELSREHIARLDTKIRMLNQLLAECDQKKREIETLLRQPVAPRTEPAPPAATAPRPADPLHDQVWSLQDEGKEVDEICSTTGLEAGEVQLILGLRKMRPPGAPAP